MSGPLTILHLTHEGHGAGSSISIALLARQQRRAGHRVVVSCPPGRWLADRLADGVIFEPVEFASRRQASAAIARLIARHQVTVVNAHSSRDRAATRALRLRRRLPQALVMTRRGMPMSSPVSALYSGLAADRTIAVSRPVARALVRRGTPPWRVTVVPNAVDLERVDRPVTDEDRARSAALIQAANGKRQAASGERLPLIGVVSRPKDHATLLEAMNLLGVPAMLCSLGFAPDARLPLAACRLPVVFLPFQDDPIPFYALFDVVVLPTRHEGLSQGLLEAMALGKAVVTTKSGGNTDLIEDGVHGLLVPPRDPPALAAALDRALADAALRQRLGAAARRRVREDFTIEKTAAATEAVYREALAQR